VLGDRAKFQCQGYRLGTIACLKRPGEFALANHLAQLNWHLNAEVEIVAAPLHEGVNVSHDFQSAL
jgi:hypothetical protein